MDNILHGLVLKPGYLKDQYLDHCCFWFISTISYLLIYINHVSDDLTTNAELFADDNSLFSIVHNMNTSTTNLNNDLNKIKNWAIQSTMNFNPDPSKQAQEVIFSRKFQNTNYDQVYFNHSPGEQVPFQKHVGMYLDTKLNFQEYLNNILSKVSKTIGLLQKLQLFFTAPTLVSAYESFIRPHLDCGDIIYDQTYNESFHEQMDSIQYNACTSYSRHYKRKNF